MAKLDGKIDEEQCNCKESDNVYINGCQICIEKHKQMEINYLYARGISWNNLKGESNV